MIHDESKCKGSIPLTDLECPHITCTKERDKEKAQERKTENPKLYSASRKKRNGGSCEPLTKLHENKWGSLELSFGSR